MNSRFEGKKRPGTRRGCCGSIRPRPHREGCPHAAGGSNRSSRTKPPTPDGDGDTLIRVRAGVNGWACRVGTRNWKPHTVGEPQVFETYEENGTAVVFEKDGWKLMVRMKDATGLKL